jgi:type IV secretion system protein TrbB
MTDHATAHITALSDEALNRRRAMLKSAFGLVIAEALADPLVIEVMINPDGRLWLDRLDRGRLATETRLQWSETERIIRLVASHIRIEVHERSPIVSAELPESGERFEGVMPPVAPAPCFSIRKPAQRLYMLDDYMRDGIMGPQAAALLKEQVHAQKNIVVVGGTSSGKTTLVNALLAEVATTSERIVILEDTRELNCAAEDCVTLRTKPGVTSLTDLVRSTLRLRPDRIIVGEVRGAEALDMLKAWNTGHPGGIATVHANSARGALYRLEQLVQEAVTIVPRRLIAEAVNTLVFIEGRGLTRRIAAIDEVTGLNSDGDYRVTPLLPQLPI